MNASKKDIATIVGEAIEIASPAERETYLARACADDADLREQIDQLLRDHAAAGNFLEQPAAVARTIDMPAVSESPGTVIGPYKLLEQIGEGGFGVVFMAEQTRPVRRKVALKVLKPGMDTKLVVARFEAERQALAIMDHPHIAKVHDGGATDSGRPYFVMELVKGAPITEYCDQNHLTPRQRLELFVPVCQAVQHAHQKGIIHRDLKPSNVLVAVHDTTPVVKVIDFGVAKALGQELTEKTLFTGFAQMIGTPLYMSPEQAGQSSLDVDTRSDIYSLGVMLYELLTGTTPFDRARLKDASYEEIRRIIREEEPARPSHRISTLEAHAGSTISQCRQSDPRRLRRLFRGELDWIVMKALEKDRTRRYETANAFALDIQRYLAGEPVQAAPPSAGYKLKKFVRKHRAALSMAVTIGVLLVAAGGISAWQTVRAANAERKNERDMRLAEARRAEAEARRADTETKAREEAQKRLKQIERYNEIVLSIFADIDFNRVKDGPDPLEAVLARRLVKVAEELNGEATGDPRTVAKLQMRLGSTLLSLGHREEAIPLFVQARQTLVNELAPDHPDALSSMFYLTQAYLAAGKLDLALPLSEETVKLSKAKLGADNPQTIMSMRNLALAYRETGKLDQALPLLEEALPLMKAKLGADHPYTFMIMDDLAAAYRRSGRLDLALPLFEEVLKLREAKLGGDHPQTLGSMNNLASAYSDAGKRDLALALKEQTVKLCKAKLGADHPDTLLGMNNLAVSYREAGKLDRELPLLEETFERLKTKLGADHPSTLKCMYNLATAYAAARKFDRALPLLEEALRLEKAKLGADHPDTLTSMDSLATAYLAAGKWVLALPLSEETFKLRKAKLGADHPEILRTFAILVAGYVAADKLDLALSIVDETLRLSEALEKWPEHAVALRNRASILTGLGLLKEAAADLGRAYDLQEPDDIWGFFLHALLRAYVSDGPGYGDACRRMVERFGDSTNPDACHQLAAVLALAREPIVEPSRAVALADRAVADNKRVWRVSTVGMACYRAAQFEPARAALEESLAIDANWNPPMVHAALAMAHYRLGNRDQASAALAKAGSARDGRVEAMLAGGVGYWPTLWWDFAQGELLYTEAYALVRGSPLPEDPRLEVLRGRALQAIGREDEARAEFARAIAMRPEDLLIRVCALPHVSRTEEFAQGLGDLRAFFKDHPRQPEGSRLALVRTHLQFAAACIDLRQWNKAAVEYDALLELQLADAAVWFEDAYLRLKLVDTEGYQQLCRRMLEHYAHSKDVNDIIFLAHTCVLAPLRLDDAAQVQQLAEQRMSLTADNPVHRVWSVHVLGLAWYRCGRSDKAVECLVKGLDEHPDWEHNVLNWLVLAMAHHRLEHKQEARQWLDKARQWIEEKNRSRDPEDRSFTPAGWAWRDWLGVQMLHQEAEALLEEERR
jgi:serine/threonine protein kinase